MNSVLQSRRIYYGWVIVGIGLLSMGFWFGIRATFSVFYVALLEEFSWGRGESAGVQPAALITYTFMAPFIGGLIDRYGPRRVILPGIVMLSLGLALCASVKSLAQFYLFYGVVVGAGVTSISIVSYTPILAHWFEKKRGLASGIAVSGSGLGTFLLVPFSQYFIIQWGWRSTFLAWGGLVFIILFPVTLLFLRYRPQDMGLLPDGLQKPLQKPDVQSEERAPNSPGREWTLQHVIKSGRFWSLVAFTALSLVGVYIIFVHSVRFFVDMGVDKMKAAYILALVGIISSLFRIFWGGISDRIGREITFTMGMFCACMGVLSLILLIHTVEPWCVYLFMGFFGAGWGATAPMFMAAATDIFKGRIFGLIYGIVEAGIGIAGAFGSWIGGFVYDRTQSYQWAFVSASAAFASACFFMWFAAPRKSNPIKTP